MATQNLSPWLCRWHGDVLPLPAMPGTSPKDSAKQHPLCWKSLDWLLTADKLTHFWHIQARWYSSSYLPSKCFKISPLSKLWRKAHVGSHSLSTLHTSDSRVSSKGTACCSAPCTPRTQLSNATRITVLVTQVTMMQKNAIFSHSPFP